MVWSLKSSFLKGLVHILETNHSCNYYYSLFIIHWIFSLCISASCEHSIFSYFEHYILNAPTCQCVDVWQSSKCWWKSFQCSNKQIFTLYNMGVTFHSCACIFTPLWLVKILTHTYEISPHILQLNCAIST